MAVRFEQLEFGETKTIPHTLTAANIPGSVFDELATRYAELKARARENVPSIPWPGNDINPVDWLPALTADSIRGIVAYLAPTLETTFQVSAGSCDDLASVTITNPDNQLVGPTSFGFSLWDVEVTIKPSYTVIAGAERLVNCRPFEDRIEAFLEHYIAWRNSDREGPRPKPSQFGLDNLEELGEEVEKGKKSRAFTIRWFLELRVARFDYRLRVIDYAQVITTRCCAP